MRPAISRTLAVASMAVGLLSAFSSCGQDKPPDCDQDLDKTPSSECGGTDCNDHDQAVGACGCGETCDGTACVFTACSGGRCGPDGCGGSCGGCEGCNVCENGTCVNRNCDYLCGVLPCGVDCGPCQPGTTCVDNFCVCDVGTCGPYCETCPAGTACQDDRCRCVPACGDRACGADGCGGSCGNCDAGTLCVDDACQALDLATFTATRWLTLVTPEYASEGDPCYADADGDGWQDHGLMELLTSFGLDVGALMTDEIAAGTIDRLLLLPPTDASPFDAWYAWAQPAGAPDHHHVTDTTTYDRPVPPVRLTACTVTDGALQCPPADLWFFDAALLREGTYDSEYNAFLLMLAYTPLRQAVVTGTLDATPGAAPVLTNGVLRGVVRRSDLTVFGWDNAGDHCDQSGHGSGTCEMLPMLDGSMLDTFMAWNWPPDSPDDAYVTFCATFTGQMVTLDPTGTPSGGR